jgi:hypothetical protein
VDSNQRRSTQIDPSRAAGIDRLSRVHVQLSNALVELSWAGREELLARAADREGANELRRRFEAVGATRPVTLDPASKTLALSVLVDWIMVENKELNELPHGIYDLWVALEREPDDESSGGD